MKKHKKNHSIYWLVIGLPVASVIMGLITFYVAVQTDDRAKKIDAQPISKTSWKEQP